MTTCSVCLESLTGPYLLVDNNASCHPCFRELFIHAISSETSYPASWAGRPLIATSYGHILGPDLLAAYDAKAVEYGCPPQERVFCSRTDPPRRPEPCGQFVGKWQNSKTGACVRCKACMWYTCLRCEESFSTTDVAGTQTAIEHECDPRKQSELEARAFNGLQRGVQWQICPNPNCKRRVELSEGCNHMRCECRTHFCFVCGNYVRDGEGHWVENGGCPRFGQKGSRQAIYDDDDQFNDNEDMSDDERAQYMQRWEYDNDDHDHDVAAQLGAFDMQIQMVAQEIREQEAAEAARLAHRYPDRLDEGEAPGEPRRRRRRRRRRHREEFDDPEQVEQWQARYDALMREGRVPRYIPVHVEWDHERQHRRRGFGAFMNNAIRAVEYHFLGRSNRPHL